MNPLVSIIIPTYNRAHFLGETLDSVLNQTYENWECIVIDDGSIDYTENLMEFYCDRDKRFQYFQRPTNIQKGSNVCRNYGFDKSLGKYIQFLDSDDLISGNKLEEQVKLLEENNSKTISISPWAAFTKCRSDNIVKNDPRIFKASQTPIEFFNGLGEYNFFLLPHCYLVNREQVRKAGLWNEYLSINQDAEFFSRVLLLHEKIVCSKDTLAFYRRSRQITTSTYSSSAKAHDVILSWKLIEQQHKMRFKKAQVLYVEGNKDEIFKMLIRSGYLGIANQYPDFFKKQKMLKRKENFLLIFRKPIGLCVKVLRLIRDKVKE